MTTQKQKLLGATILIATFIITFNQYIDATRFPKSYSSRYAPEDTAIERKDMGNTGRVEKIEAEEDSQRVQTDSKVESSPEYTPEQLKERIAQKGKEVFGEQEAQYLVELVDRESDFRPTAKNPQSTAYGLFQFLDGTWEAYGGEKTSDPEKQIELGIKYISQRYGTPSKAIAFHNVNNWY